MAKKEKVILLALKNEEDISEFTKFLNRKEYTFISSDNGSKAIELALDGPPALIIVDCQLPLIEGSHLFKILRNNPYTSSVPFLFISSRPLDIKGFNVDHDIFITKPFLWEELHDHIQRSFSSTGIPKDMGDKEIQGKLSRVPLVDILQMLHMNKNEGELNLTTGDLNGVVYVKDGEIYNAACGKVENEKALFRLLAWTDGIFEFRPVKLSIERMIETSCDHLLMEAMRQLDELKHSKDKFPDENLRIGPGIDTNALPKGLKPVMYEVMKLVEYYPRVGDIIEYCTFTDYEAYSTIANLLERDILKETMIGMDESNNGSTIIAPVNAIKIKEKIISNWSEMMFAGYGKILMIATTPNLVKTFAYSLKFLPDFSLNLHSAIVSDSEQSASVIGEVGTLRLYGNMEVTLFATPLAENMGPFLNSFSSNILGLIMLWDTNDEAALKRLKASKDIILSKRRIPVVHMHVGATAPEKKETENYSEALGVKKEENSYDLSSSDNKAIFEIFKTLLTDISGEGFVTSKVQAF